VTAAHALLQSAFDRASRKDADVLLVASAVTAAVEMAEREMSAGNPCPICHGLRWTSVTGTVDLRQEGGALIHGEATVGCPACYQTLAG
jgi:hypothetical protein